MPGAHCVPFHFNTLPVLGVAEAVSTSLKKLILNALMLITTTSVSVAIAVAMFVPPFIRSVSVDPLAVAVPSSLVTVLYTFAAPAPSKTAAST